MSHATPSRPLPVALSLATVLSASLAACFGSNALPGASDAHVAATAVAPGAGDRPVCAGRAKQPTNTTWSVDVGGTSREFVVHVPPTYDPSHPTPVVLNFHGYHMGPKLQEWLTTMSAKSDAAGFLLVYPRGTGSPSSFNAGACCGDAARDGTDDVAFTRAMLDRLEADLCVDPRRVFATGMSNGGFMSHRLACELSDRIAAVAPVAGVNGVAECNPTRPVPVLHFHGTDDPTIPYAGNAERKWRSVKESTQGWVTRNACKAPPVETLAKGNVHCVTYGECKDGADVTLCTVLGGGHTWPGGADIPGIVHQGMTTHDVSADDVIWTFFENHPMPAR
jgi:polyhydroxybutyrate depolymerase